MSLLCRSLCGGVLILLMLGMRKGLGDRLPPAARLIIWGLLLLKLLVPWAVPAQVSLLAVSPDTKAAFTELTAAVVNRPVDTAAPTESSWLLWIWGMGAALTAAGFGLSSLYGRRLSAGEKLPAAEWRRWLPEAAGKRLIVCRCERLRTPAMIGLFYPRILLPSFLDGTDGTGMRHMLLHEWMHIRRRHVLWKWIAAAAVCMHWFNPLAWLLFRAVGQDLELDCDRAVLRRLGAVARARYACSLIDMAEQQRLYPFYSGFGRTAVEVRIRAIMSYKRTKGGTAVSAVCLASMLTMALVLAQPAVAELAGSMEQTGPSLTLETETALIWPVPASKQVSAAYGARWGSFHRGVDITAAVGEPIVAAGSGRVAAVTEENFNGGYGRCLLLDHGDGKQTLYAHCDRIAVSPGEYVQTGQTIATVGCTGDCTGPALHFEVRENGVCRDPIACMTVA